MAVDSHNAHILESRKKVMFATAFGKETSLLGVTRSSTIVARAPCFQEVVNINCELLHTAVGGQFPLTHCQREFWSKATVHNGHNGHPVSVVGMIGQQYKSIICLIA